MADGSRVSVATPPGADAPVDGPLSVRLAGSRAAQRWIARVPGLRWIARREGEALFDLIAGFCHSQMLLALVRLGLLEALAAGPQPIETLARAAGLPGDRTRLVLRSGQAMGLCRLWAGRWRLTRRGAALIRVPGLTGMIDHHDVLYRDLADPVALLRGETETELAEFWPYVFGAGAADDPLTAARYSRLMTESLTLVAEDTLDAIDLRGVRHLMDVGGGTGAFLCHAAPFVDRVTLFDLPAVVTQARKRFAASRLSGRAEVVPGSFRDDPLPAGADAISLVRVLYDHDDATVDALLRRCHDALPPGGRLIVSEPMTGGAEPHRPGDIYYTLYCLAMRTGRARSATEICALLRAAGFARATPHRSRRPFVTSVVTAVRPA